MSTPNIHSTPEAQATVSGQAAPSRECCVAGGGPGKLPPATYEQFIKMLSALSFLRGYVGEGLRHPRISDDLRARYTKILEKIDEGLA